MLDDAFGNDFAQLEDVQTKKLNQYLSYMVAHGGSDLHVKSGSQIRARFNGELVKLTNDILSHADGIALAKELLRTQFTRFVEEKSLDFAYKLNEDYRFRVNIFFQVDGVSAVFRVIPTKLPTFESLKLPAAVKKLIDKTNRGIILVTGPTGSGKTTTLAAIINYINQIRTSHIVTIEDPIEFVFRDNNCIINQRALGQDCNTFADSMRAALREDPDIIFVGEMRDLVTIETALHAAETGHLVLSTLHTLDAKETIGRVIGMFETEEQNRIRQTLASVLEGVISQRLCPTTDNKRVAAIEILMRNVRIRDMILESRDTEINDAISDAKNTYGMQTFDQHLLELYLEGTISIETALEKATNRADLELMIKNANLSKMQQFDSTGEVIGDIVELKELDEPKKGTIRRR